MSDTPNPKLRVATTSLAGCFGCHMSLLDIDERIDLLQSILDVYKKRYEDVAVAIMEEMGRVEGLIDGFEREVFL